jgi:hypothetical protein
MMPLSFAAESQFVTLTGEPSDESVYCPANLADRQDSLRMAATTDDAGFHDSPRLLRMIARERC